MIAAIVKPVEECSRPATANCSGKTISFSMEERVALWKNDERLPGWAWVFEDSTDELHKMMFCLVEFTEEDGYELDFVVLCGPDRSDWRNKPYRRYKTKVTLVGSDGYEEEVTFAGCKIMLICDAARKAVEFDTGRLETFEGCAPWRRLAPDTELLSREEKAKAENAMAELKEKEVNEYQRLVKDAGMFFHY